MATTLTTTEILADIVESFKVKVPMLRMMSTDFRSDTAKKGQTLKMHIRKLPNIGEYDETKGGYFNGANEARDLLEDVDVTIDRHKHVTLGISHLNAISDEKYGISVGDSAYVLGKAITDSILAKFLASNISRQEVASIANTDRSTLGKIRSQMNKAGALSDERYMIANTEVYTDPETGISLLGITHQEPGTLKLFLTVTCLWGSTVGAAGQGVDKQTDRAGVRVVTA